jgi:serine/threonine protein kinase
MKVLTLFTQACRGIKAVHAAGIVHADVCAANCVIKDDELKIIDLGSAEGVEEAAGLVLASDASLDLDGTPETTAAPQPDLCIEEDIVGLGDLLATIVESTCKSPAIWGRVDITPIIEQCTAEPPRRRYDTVTELMCDVEDCLRDLRTQCGHGA